VTRKTNPFFCEKPSAEELRLAFERERSPAWQIALQSVHRLLSSRLGSVWGVRRGRLLAKGLVYIGTGQDPDLDSVEPVEAVTAFNAACVYWPSDRIIFRRAVAQTILVVKNQESEEIVIRIADHLEWLEVSFAGERVLQ
jgi:hypothetical protein